MSFIHTNWFKYLKNLIIGIGASAVMLGALYKIQSWPGGGIMLTIGLCTEAFIFAFLGIIGPDKDYYWEKLYPGLDEYDSNIKPITAGSVDDGSGAVKPLDGEKVENRLGGMLSELQSMSKSLGSLKALQEVDFSQTVEKIKQMNDFYSKMNETMEEMSESVEDTKRYKAEMEKLNENLSSLNSVYGNVLHAMNTPAKQSNT